MGADIISRKKTVMRKRVLVVCTTDSMIWNFLVPHIEALQKNGNVVECACSNTGFYTHELRDKYRMVIHTIDFSRSPYNPRNLKCLSQLNALVKDNKYDTIHCHEPVGGVMGRLVGKLNSLKVYYTAHGFHFYKGAPLKNWVLFYPVERWLAQYTDVIITINKEDHLMAQKFKAKKVEYVPGVGIDTQKFGGISVDKAVKSAELCIPDGAFTLLSVGELIKRKNFEIVIKALAKLNKPKIIYLICGIGDLDSHLKRMANDLGVDVRFLGFRKDISEICSVADIFIFPSLQEGLPVALMEAMAGGLPVVCSNIRGNTDLIENGKGGYLVEPDDVDGFAGAISKLLDGNTAMGQFNNETIKHFDLKRVKEKMIEIYDA